MSINLYQPTPSVTTDLVIYTSANTEMSCPASIPCPPPPTCPSPALPQGILEPLILLVGMFLQYALARFRVWTKKRRLGARMEPKEVDENIYEEVQPRPASAPLPPPPSALGDAFFNVGNPFTNPFVNGPHQG